MHLRNDRSKLPLLACIFSESSLRKNWIPYKALYNQIQQKPMKAHAENASALARPVSKSTLHKISLELQHKATVADNDTPGARATDCCSSPRNTAEGSWLGVESFGGSRFRLPKTLGFQGARVILGRGKEDLGILLMTTWIRTFRGMIAFWSLSWGFEALFYV